MHADSLQIEQYFDDLLGNGALSHSTLTKQHCGEGGAGANHRPDPFT